MKLKHDVKYRYPMWVYPNSVTIPRGTSVIAANNLPESSCIKFWVEPWDGMDEIAEGHMGTYGFGVTKEDVE